MTTTQIASPSTETGFRKSLLDRFFNPRSFFLHSFMSSLRKIESSASDTAHVVTVGLLMDEIINSDDKLALFDQLDKFDLFRRYHEQLDSGIDYLQNSRLTTQQMMEIVGVLGNSLSSTLLQLISREETRTPVLDMLGLEFSGNGNGSSNDNTISLPEVSETNQESPGESSEMKEGVSVQQLLEMDKDIKTDPSEDNALTESLAEDAGLKEDQEATLFPDETIDILSDELVPEEQISQGQEKDDKETPGENDGILSLDSIAGELDLADQTEVEDTTGIESETLLSPEFPLEKPVQSEQQVAGDSISAENESFLSPGASSQTEIQQEQQEEVEKTTDDNDIFSVESVQEESDLTDLLQTEDTTGVESESYLSSESIPTENPVLGETQDVEEMQATLKDENELFDPQESNVFSVETELPGKAEIVESTSQDEAGSASIEKDDSKQPWSYFQDDVSDKLLTLRKNLDTFSQDTKDWKSFKKIKKDYKDLRDWSMIQGDEGIEALSHKVLLLFETAYIKGIEKRHTLKNILNDAWECIDVVNKAGRGSERLDIVRLTAHQIDKQRQVYPDELPVLSVEEQDFTATVEASPTELHTSTEIEEQPEIVIQDEPETDDVYEFDETALNENIVSEPDSIEAPDEYPEQDFDLKTDSLSNEDTAEKEFNTIRESELLSEMMEEQSTTFEELELQPKDKTEELDIAEGADPQIQSGISEEETNILSGIEDSSLLEVTDELGSPQENSTDQSQMKSVDLDLPGSEDEDLLHILDEIKKEEDGLDKNGIIKPVVENQSAEELDDSSFGKYIEQLQEDFELSKNDQPAGNVNGQDKAIEPVSVDGEVEKGEILSDLGNGYDFVSESDMYFSFARKAFQNLMKNPSDVQSMDDIELAFYSLKSLAKKLGYKTTYQLLSYSEIIIRDKKQNKTYLNTSQVNSLYTALTELEQTCRERRLNESERQAWLKQQLSVIQSWGNSSSSEDPENKAITPIQQDDKAKTADDPLDFLLFEDTSKFFKQLLRE